MQHKECPNRKNMRGYTPEKTAQTRKDSDLLHKIYKLETEKKMMEIKNKELYKRLKEDSSKREEIEFTCGDKMKDLQEFIQLAHGSQLDLMKSILKDKDHTIMCLQQGLKESVEIISEHETEIKKLQVKVDDLQQELASEKNKDYACKVTQNVSNSFGTPRSTTNTNEIIKLKEQVENKQAELEASESHLKTCHMFIEELQKRNKKLEMSSRKFESSIFELDKNSTHTPSYNNQELQRMLEVSEKNIKSLEERIIYVQNENLKLKKLNKNVEENENFKKHLSEIKKKAYKLKFYTQEFHEEIENLVKTLSENNNDAVLKTDEDVFFRRNTSIGTTSLEEMKRHVSIYVAAVSRFLEHIRSQELKKGRILHDFLTLED